MYDAHPGQTAILRSKCTVLPSNDGRVNVTLTVALSSPAREVITREATKMVRFAMVASFAQIEMRCPRACSITLITGNAAYTVGPYGIG
jgi:hypothetical protein